MSSPHRPAPGSAGTGPARRGSAEPDLDDGVDLVDDAFMTLRRFARAGGRTAPSLRFQPGGRAARRARVPGMVDPETGEAAPGVPKDAGEATAGVPKDAGEPAAGAEARPGRGRRRRRGIPTGRDGYIVPRRRDVDSLGGLVGREMRRRGWTAHLAGGWITGHWEDIVGEKIAQHTRIEMIKDTTVFITCDSTAWATNLRYMQRHILQTIARTVGPDVVTQLKIFGPKAPSWRKGPLHVKGRGPRDTYG